MSSWWDAAVSTLLGSACARCRRPGRPWCPDCTQALEGAVDPWQIGDDPPVVASCRYEEPLPEAIVGFKDRGIMSLRPLLGNVLAAGVMQALQIVAQSASPAQIPTLVPAASSPASVRARGFDHMWDLAQVAAQTCDVPARRTLRSGARADQAGLSFAARRRNVRATMRVREPGRGPVVIVDDVTTSGATLTECHRALTEGGFAVVAHVVIASSLTDPACAVTL